MAGPTRAVSALCTRFAPSTAMAQGENGCPSDELRPVRSLHRDSHLVRYMTLYSVTRGCMKNHCSGVKANRRLLGH